MVSVTVGVLSVRGSIADSLARGAGGRQRPGVVWPVQTHRARRSALGWGTVRGGATAKGMVVSAVDTRATPPQGKRRWERGHAAAVVAALVVVGVALALPSPQPSQPSQPSTAPPPARLTAVWPGATPVPLTGVLPDGSTYRPSVVVDATTSIGVATTPDMETARLVVRRADTVRAIHAVPTGRATIAAVTLVDDQIVWAEVAAQTTGDGAQTSIWRTGLTGGAVRRLAAHPGDMIARDSAYDLLVADGTVHWAVAIADGERGEIRSIGLAGGSVRVRPLDRDFGLTAWPWATTSTSGEPGSVELLNLSTGERRVVSAGPEEFLSCSPSWCRVVTLVDDGQEIEYSIRRGDGSDAREFGDTPMNVDVALMDRFEVLAADAESGPAGRLSLYDIASGRTVLLADSAAGTVGSDGRHLWWSTGDNEVLQWHVVDLRRLT
jgi:hypothetical protein